MRLHAGPALGPHPAWGTVRPDNLRERYPAGWKDPLELYGRLRWQLIPPIFDESIERVQASELVNQYRAQWVWRNRQRLVSLRKYLARIRNTAGTKQPTR